MHFWKKCDIILWYDLHFWEVFYNEKCSKKKEYLVLVKLIGGFLYEDEKNVSNDDEWYYCNEPGRCDLC